MQPSSPSAAPPPYGPRFYLTSRQPLRPGVLLLAAFLAAAALALMLYAMQHKGRLPSATGKGGNGGSASGATPGSSPDDDKDDDPNQIDTIVLGDPAEAPTPGRTGNHVSPVHPTIVIVLPRSGKDVGLIPASAAGRLLYSWLGAFNQANPSELANLLPGPAPSLTVNAQLGLRQRTGGFNLISSCEVSPGIVVFRLLDQTSPGTEALGTLVMLPDSIPPRIQSFSLRDVPSPSPPPPGTDPTDAHQPPA